MYTFYYLYHRKFIGEILEIYEKSIKLAGWDIIFPMQH
jgi:hypothetical protein